MPVPVGQIDKIVARVKLNLGRGTANSTINDYVIEWINLVQREICQQANFWFAYEKQSFVFFGGEYRKSLTATFKDEDGAWLESDTTPYTYTRLEPIDYEDVFKKYGNTTGTPDAWLIDNGYLEIHPIPTTPCTIVLAQWTYLSDLSEGGVANTLTGEFPYILEAGATMWGFRYLQEFDDAAVWKSQFDQYLKDLKILNAEKILPDEFVLKVRPDVDGDTNSSIANREE